MAHLTLAQLFGTGATQSASHLTILKSNLPGLTPSTANSPEKLLAGLIVLARYQIEGALRTEIGELITTDDRSSIEFNNSKHWDLVVQLWAIQFVIRDSQPKIRHLFTVEELKLDENF